MAAARRCRVAVAQLCSTSDAEANFRHIASLFKEAKARDCSFLALPECFAWIGRSPVESQAFAQPLTGSLFQRYASLCREHGLWASFGGFHTQPLNRVDDRLENTQILVDPKGRQIATYVKAHLFDVCTLDGTFKESGFTRPGSGLTMARNTPLGNVGLTICYDVRFPPVYEALRAAGAEVLLVPSAFMPSTGAAHWEVLLRARAIETQCFVIAAAQVGRHNDKRASYGHSIIIDPWGKILAECDGTNPGLAVAELDFSELEKVREKMPVLNHRRVDLFGPAASAAVHVVDADQA